TRRDAAPTLVPGVTPEHGGQPPETASPLAWRPTTIGVDAMSTPIPLSRSAFGSGSRGPPVLGEHPTRPNRGSRQVLIGGRNPRCCCPLGYCTSGPTSRAWRTERGPSRPGYRRAPRWSLRTGLAGLRRRD